MRNRILGRLGILILCIAMGAAFASAQTLDRMTVDIPFDFVVGKKVFSAGAYRLDRYPDVPIWRIASEDGSRSVLVFTGSRLTRRIPEQGNLRFNKYGDTYFLSEITAPGTSRTAVLSRPDLELELAAHRKGVPASISVEP